MIAERRSSAEHPVEAALAEVEDLLSYCNDILASSACWQLFECKAAQLYACRSVTNK